MNYLHQTKRQGFIILWAAAALCVILLLAGAVMAAFSEMIRREGMAESSLSGMYLLQETMETIKYNHAFQQSLPVPGGRIFRNGKPYEVTVVSGQRDAEGISMKSVMVQVEGPYDVIQSAELLLAPHPEEL